MSAEKFTKVSDAEIFVSNPSAKTLGDVYAQRAQIASVHARIFSNGESEHDGLEIDFFEMPEGEKQFIDELHIRLKVAEPEVTKTIEQAVPTTESVKESIFLKAALPMAARNVRVVPTNTARVKECTRPNWPDIATTDLNQINRWAQECPDANCCSVAYGTVGELCILETDDNSVIEKIQAETGNDLQELRTFKVRSSPGHGHFYFRHSADSVAVGNIAQTEESKFSFRAHRQYVLSPNSVHPRTGKPYEAVDESEIITIPDSLTTWLRNQKPSASAKDDPVHNPELPIPDGERDIDLFKIACSMRSQFGWDENKIYEELLVINQERCVPPLSPETVRIKAHSACKYKADVKRDDSILMGGKRLTDDPTTPDTPTSESSEAQQELAQLKALREQAMSSETENEEELEADDGAGISPFDESLVDDGFIGRAVRLATDGTTYPKSFAYELAHSFIGMEMCDLEFENASVTTHPKQNLFLCGISGTGKNDSIDRMIQVLGNENDPLPIASVTGSDDLGVIKIRSYTDFKSGQGIRDAFLWWARSEDGTGGVVSPHPKRLVVVIPEGHVFATNLGRKEPKALDVMEHILNLSEGTDVGAMGATIQTAKSRKKIQEVAHKCFFGVIVCAQSKEIVAHLLANLGAVGVGNRFTPEYAPKPERGNLPKVDKEAARELRNEIRKYRFGAGKGPMKFSPQAKARLDSWYAGLPPREKDSRTSFNVVQMSSYRIAWSNQRSEVSLDDVERAVRNYPRQGEIRGCFFGVNAGTKLQFCAHSLKAYHAKLRAKIIATDPAKVKDILPTYRDLLTKLGAYSSDGDRAAAEQAIRSSIGTVKTVMTGGVLQQVWDLSPERLFEPIFCKHAGNGKTVTKFVPVFD